MKSKILWFHFTILMKSEILWQGFVRDLDIDVFYKDFNPTNIAFKGKNHPVRALFPSVPVTKTALT